MPRVLRQAAEKGKHQEKQVDHRKRFERWRSKLPTNTAYLVDRVLACIVPEFEAKGDLSRFFVASQTVGPACILRASCLA